MFQSVVQVALGGAIGSVARFLTYQALPAPWGTMGINILGSFLIGLLYMPMARLGLSALVVTGILGGFTTFSAFSLDAMRLWSEGDPLQAALYTAGSVILSLIAVVIGAWVFGLLQQQWAP